MHIHTYKHTRPCACIEKVDVFLHFTLFLASDTWNHLNCWIPQTTFQSSTAVTLLNSCIAALLALNRHSTASIPCRGHCFGSIFPSNVPIVFQWKSATPSLKFQFCIWELFTYKLDHFFFPSWSNYLLFQSFKKQVLLNVSTPNKILPVISQWIML